MIDGIDGFIVGLKLGHLKVPREWLLHYPQYEGRLTIESFVGLHREIIIESIINLFVELSFGYFDYE